jgi:hypothetical protein
MDEQRASTPGHGRSAWQSIVILIVAGGIGLYLYHHHHGSPVDRSDEIAKQIGADSCDQSGYEIKNRLDGSKSVIYDCDIDGRMKCVTEDGGIPSDSTVAVKLLFADTLGTAKPYCLNY